MRGPEYPRRPNLAPATLRPIARPTPPLRDRWRDHSFFSLEVSFFRWREDPYEVRLRQEEEERRSQERESEQRRREEELERRTWNKENERNSGNSIRRNNWQKDNKKKGPTDFYLRKERYDPFAFQSTPKPKVGSIFTLNPKT